MSRSMSIQAAAILLCVIAISALAPQGVKAEWSQDYPIALNKYGDVTCVERYDGDVVVGGFFTSINGVDAGSIARWDGDQWMAMGAGFGFQGGTARIRDLIVYDGLLIAAGTFDRAGAVSTRGIAMWDGKSWQDMDGGTTWPFVGYNSGVSTLMVYEGALIAGGNFVGIGDVTTNNIARWNEQRWKVLGTGTPQIVHCLTEFQGSLYAGGAITNMNPVQGNAVWRWTGTSWASTSLEGVGVAVFALNEYDGYLVAGGIAFFTGGSLAFNNGGEWQQFAGGVSYQGEVHDLEVFMGNLIVSGQFGYVGGDPTNVAANIARWDGGEWHDFDYGLWKWSGAPRVSDVLLNDDGFLAAGIFTHAKSPPGTPMLGLAVWTEDIIGINQKSVSALQIPDLFGGATWNFSWKTNMYSSKLFDKVVVRDYAQTAPGCMLGEQVFIHNEIDVFTIVTELPNGEFLHEMTVNRNECSPGCDYLFDVSSTADDGYTVSSTDNEWNTGYCIANPPRSPRKSDSVGIAGRTELEQNHPNPFNPSTVIGYTIANGANVTLAVYDVSGRLVRTLVNEFQGQNRYEVTWNGIDNAGSQVASGAYFYRLETATYTETRKLLFLK